MCWAAVCWAAMAGLPLGSAAAQTSADPGNVRTWDEAVAWQAPAECPSREVVLRELTALVGSAMGSPQGVSASGVVRAEVGSPSAYRLSLEVVQGGERRVRELAAPTCAELTSAAAVAIALAATGGELESAPATSFTDEPAAADTERPARADPAATEAEGAASAEPDRVPVGAAGETTPKDAWWSARAELLVDFSSLPAAAPGVEAALVARGSRVQAELFGFGLPPRDEGLGPGRQARFGLWGAGLRGCARASEARGSLSVCGQLEGGELSAEGRGLAQAARRRDGWAALGASGALESPLSADWQLVLRADALAPLLRQAYGINGLEEVHRVPWAVLRVGGGVAWIF